jgi:acyl carrier protein
MDDLDVASDALSDSDDLYDAGLKSLATLQLILALEREFDLEFPESMLHRGTFSSLARIRESVSIIASGRPDAPRRLH